MYIYIHIKKNATTRTGCPESRHLYANKKRHLSASSTSQVGGGVGGGYSVGGAAQTQRVLVNQMLYKTSAFMCPLSLPRLPGGGGGGGPILHSIFIARSTAIENPETKKKNSGKRNGGAGGGGGGGNGRDADAGENRVNELNKVFLYCAFAGKEGGGGGGSPAGGAGGGGVEDAVPLVVEGERVRVCMTLVARYIYIYICMYIYIYIIIYYYVHMYIWIHIEYCLYVIYVIYGYI
jgi:hypothetical protein